MARTKNLRRLHWPAERHDTTAPGVQPRENFNEVPPGSSVLLERPAPKLQEGGFVRDRGEHGLRTGPPALASDWAPGIQRNDTAAFEAMAEHERLVRFMEALVGQQKGEPSWPLEQIREATLGFAG
jgi:hypothetical protein